MKKYRFTFGPWNISTGADPFGPPVRREVEFAQKIREYKKLGFDGVQLHDDDVVPSCVVVRRHASPFQCTEVDDSSVVPALHRRRGPR